MHERFMSRALELARIAEGRTSPNPAVGAVLVRDGEIVGEGYHHFAGSAHAEVEAIRDAGPNTAGSTIYVTLEPCNHQGRTSACTEAILAVGISRLVYAVSDPNPDVDGNGAERLREAGLEVIGDVLADEARHLNRFFLHHAHTGRPWVIAKFASSLDGKIATSSGESKWITGTDARARAHELRSLVDGVVVGAGTVISDDPELTVRHVNGRTSGDGGPQPVRIILDSLGRVPIHSRVFSPDLPGSTIAASTAKIPAGRVAELRDSDVAVIKLPADATGKVSIPALLDALGDQSFQSLMVEGGGTVHGSFLSEGLVDEVWAFLSPSLIGGADSPTAVGGAGIPQLKDRFEMENSENERLGNDILIRGIRTGWRIGERTVSNQTK